MTVLRGLLLLTLAALVAFGVFSFVKHHQATYISSATAQPIRIKGVSEPEELLIEPQNKASVSAAQRELVDALGINKTPSIGPTISNLDSYIDKHPNVIDPYIVRAELYCEKGDAEAVIEDINRVLSGGERLIPNDDLVSERNGFLAMKAKLLFRKGQREAAKQDVEEILKSFSSDVSYLTDGRVKTTDKANSICGWLPSEIDSLTKDSSKDVGVVLFQGLYYSAFSPLDHDARPFAESAMRQAVAMAPNNAQSYFYSAVALKKQNAFERIGFNEEQTKEFNQKLENLYSEAIKFGAANAYGPRAEVYLELKEWQKAVADYNEAVKLKPNDYALWNDRGLAKQETVDKEGALDDFNHAIALKKKSDDMHALASSLENKADLQAKLGNLQQAKNDYTSLIGVKMQGALLFMNLEFFRTLYPEYEKVEDSRLVDKLHRMYYPNFSDADFQKSMSKADGTHPSVDADLPSVYLKRADISLTQKKYGDAKEDYRRAHTFYKPTDRNYYRWRTPPGLTRMSIDLQSLDIGKDGVIDLWARPIDTSGDPLEDATQYSLSCSSRQLRRGSLVWETPIPGSRDESVFEYFCH